MDIKKFIDPTAGRLVPTVNNLKAFVPAPLPPVINMASLAVPMAEATHAIGELRGASRRLNNPYILIRPLQHQEALTSSAMEGTFTTDDELVLAAAGIDDAGRDTATREVNNYLKALKNALDFVQNDNHPISQRMLRDAHRTLLSGVGSERGANKRPGEFKVHQNAIGKRGETLNEARFIPPPPSQTQDCMDDLERYINSETQSIPLAIIDLALVHYQFETIHPFADGNGRVGRMLLSLMAVERKLLDMPVLYMSPALEQNKDEYIDLMFKVSTLGEWNNWIKFFFRIVCESASKTILTIDRLISLQEEYRLRATAAMRSASAVMLVDHLFEQPVVTVPAVQELLGVTYRGARNVIDKLIETGVLLELSDLRPKVFISIGILHVARPVETES